MFNARRYLKLEKSYQNCVSYHITEFQNDWCTEGWDITPQSSVLFCAVFVLFFAASYHGRAWYFGSDRGSRCNSTWAVQSLTKGALIFLGSLVRLGIEAFDVEYACNCQYDWVSVYNSQGFLLQTWCGSQGNGQKKTLQTTWPSGSTPTAA